MYSNKFLQLPVTCMYINSLYNTLHIHSVIFREGSDQVRRHSVQSDSQ